MQNTTNLFFWVCQKKKRLFLFEEVLVYNGFERSLVVFCGSKLPWGLRPPWGLRA